MKAFVNWVLSQRYWIVLAAVVAAPLLPVVTAGLTVLNSLHRGTSQGFAMALAGAVVLTALAVVTRGAWMDLAVVGSFALLCGALLGALLNWSGGLSLAFQGVVLASYLVAGALMLVGPSPELLVGLIIERIHELMEAGAASEEQLQQLDQLAQADTMLLGIMFAVVFAQLVGALLLGYWWFGMVRNEIRFGVEFRALRLGRLLGIIGMVLVTAGLIIPAPVIQNLTPIALLAFLFQGVAVMHSWAHTKEWHPAFLWPVYLVLITPWTWIALFGLSAVGLIDNVFQLRPRPGA
jgi:hypothetical protein